MTIGVQQLMLEVERVRDAFQRAVYAAADLEAALAVTAADCALPPTAPWCTCRPAPEPTAAT